MMQLWEELAAFFIIIFITNALKHEHFKITH